MTDFGRPPGNLNRPFDANQITSCWGANAPAVSPIPWCSRSQMTWLFTVKPATSMANRKASCTSQRQKQTRAPFGRRTRHASRSHQMKGLSSFTIGRNRLALERNAMP
jgi:hypothetical protein